MSCRLLIIVTVLLCAAIPASGINQSQPASETVAIVASRLKEKDFKGAWDAALNMPEGGERDFLLGITSARLANWEESVRYLAGGAVSYPLLADYALYHQARGLYNLGRFDEALQPLRNLRKQFPGSPLLRASELLLADSLFAKREYQHALDAYLQFMEKYASGTDAITALYQTAKCREQLGDIDSALLALKKVWLSYPASPLAASAEADIRRLAESGTQVVPYSDEELFRRGITLYDLGKFDQALRSLRAIPLESRSSDFTNRVTLKTGQALFKARRYREAEELFASLLAATPVRMIADEASFWLGRSLARNGKEDEAYSVYLKLAENSPASILADNALMEAAMIRKHQKKVAEALLILKKLLNEYPDSDLKQTALWEIAWNSYLTGDTKTAAGFFQKLAGQGGVREKALYWHGRTVAANGDASRAQASFALLLNEFPLGYYAHTYRRDAGITESPSLLIPNDINQLLPLPIGFDRVKALIAFGLYEEANKELAVAKRKLTGRNRELQGIARLYLEMGNFHRAMSVAGGAPIRRPDKENLYLWRLNYPLAFREEVERQALKSGIPTGLVYSIIRTESNFYPAALSPAGAIGLMQLMPSTAKALANGENGKFKTDRLTMPKENIRMGIRHLRGLLTLYKGDRMLAVAAYNAGEGNVNRWLKTAGDLQRDVFIESIPFAETRRYVKKVLEGSENYNRLYKFDSQTTPKPAPLAGQQADADTQALAPGASPPIIPIPNQSALFVGSSSAPQHTGCMPSSPQSSPP
ncbi:MAG: transglycosylase SLT domain-containing protein [Geobacteraceae bacterium]